MNTRQLLSLIRAAFNPKPLGPAPKYNKAWYRKTFERPRKKRRKRGELYGRTQKLLRNHPGKR